MSVFELLKSKKDNSTIHNASGVDPVEEINRYKNLLDQNIITQEEFDAKRRQILGL